MLSLRVQPSTPFQLTGTVEKLRLSQSLLFCAPGPQAGARKTGQPLPCLGISRPEWDGSVGPSSLKLVKWRWEEGLVPWNQCHQDAFF